MKQSVEKNWTDALEGKAEAYRKLGIYYLRGAGGRAIISMKKRKRRRRLAYLCLERAAAMGDGQAFYLLHHHFSKGKKVIDDRSYRQIADEYAETKDPDKRKYLQYYLKQGTKQQQAECRKSRRLIFGQVPAYRREQAAAHLRAEKKKESDTEPAHP